MTYVLCNERRWARARASRALVGAKSKSTCRRMEIAVVHVLSVCMTKRWEEWGGRMWVNAAGVGCGTLVLDRCRTGQGRVRARRGEWRLG
ncbi:hypothetical protein EJ04DRAFT_249313 [Polyplosphaeria fusca]|uniref:Uncharacterized protein n=1 Tax=Polyplosphaeria fusca TaxID=682080 RepID=A0A9P4QUT3_9PLEO|nr:hypothetical protein EJ04DRAFT_249313 [Polyplosphaeria fusca]